MKDAKARNNAAWGIAPEIHEVAYAEGRAGVLWRDLSDDEQEEWYDRALDLVNQDGEQ